MAEATNRTQNRNEFGERLAGAHPEFAIYIDEQIAEHIAASDPPSDFITRLIRTEVDDYRLSDLELEADFEWKKVATFWANGPESLPARCQSD